MRRLALDLPAIPLILAVVGVLLVLLYVAGLVVWSVLNGRT